MITNITKKIIISREEKICKDIFSKCKGLMFTRKIKKPLIFVNKNPELTRIHMFFVFYPIDVAWLDEDKKIIHKEMLKPFTFSKSIKAKYVLEMKTGDLKAEIGHKLDFNI